MTDLTTDDSWVEYTTDYPPERGQVQLSIYGTFVATVTVQIKDKNQSSSEWRDLQGSLGGVVQFTEPTEQIGTLVAKWTIRAGIKAGDYTSGTVTVTWH